MSKLIAAVKGFVKDDSGATMVEYGLLVALIAAACVAAITSLGTTLSGKFTAANASFPT